MTSTVKTLLKLLLSGNLEEKDLQKYLDLDLKYIKKNIQLLDNYLVSHNYGYIKKKNETYSVKNKKNDFSKLFSDLSILSKKEREDIICLELLLNKQIKLEELREKLIVSRSTINNDLKRVKDYLEQNQIFLESKSYRGVFLKNLDSQNIKNILCEKIMKLLVGKEFITSYEKNMLDKINILDEKKYYRFYLKIIEKFKLRKSFYVFYAIYSMALIEKLEGKFDYEINLSCEKEEVDKILKIVEEISLDFEPELEITPVFRMFLTGVILKVKKYPLFEPKLIDSFNKFILELESDLKLDLKNKKELIFELKQIFTIGYLNYKYNYLWIRPKVEVSSCLKFTSYIQRMLKKLGIEMFYSDILGISEEVIDFFIREEYSKKNKILCITTNSNFKYYDNIVGYMNTFYPKIKLEIISFLDFDLVNQYEINKYDLIVSEIEILVNVKYKKVRVLNIVTLNEVLINSILEKYKIQG